MGHYKPYDYIPYLSEEIPKHMNSKKHTFIISCPFYLTSHTELPKFVEKILFLHLIVPSLNHSLQIFAKIVHELSLLLLNPDLQLCQNIYKLNQDFDSAQINQKWCTDFTYLFLTDGSKRYNCTIIDLHVRNVIASVTDRSITADLAKRTLEKAIKSQLGIDLNKLIVHSDYAEENTMPKFLPTA